MAREQRRLAAIVSADVAGHSRLMGQDESGTLAALTSVPLEAGRQLAAGIPGARFVSFASESHIFMHGEPSAERFFEEIRLFLAK